MSVQNTKAAAAAVDEQGLEKVTGGVFSQAPSVCAAPALCGAPALFAVGEGKDALGCLVNETALNSVTGGLGAREGEYIRQGSGNGGSENPVNVFFPND